MGIRVLSDPAVNSKRKAPGYYLDGHGLYLPIGPDNARSWVPRYTLNKRIREMGLGSVDNFGLWYRSDCTSPTGSRCAGKSRQRQQNLC